MPRKNAIKEYVNDGFYHLYNRGVDKSPIFFDHLDYSYFIRLLVYYLSYSPLEANSAINRRNDRASHQDLSQAVKLISYCLMPNHYHLLIKQLEADGLTRLMKRVSASYALYFNNRHNRIGHLFESYCKGVLITSDEQLIHTSRYVHLNSQALGVDFRSYSYSNYRQIISSATNTWTDASLLLDYFDQDPSRYAEFVESGSNLATNQLIAGTKAFSGVI